MKKAKVKYNMKAFEEIRRLPKTKSTLESSGSKIAEACGDGYEMRSGEGKTRSRASVLTTNAKAMRDNRKNNTLLRNMDAGKL